MATQAGTSYGVSRPCGGTLQKTKAYVSISLDSGIVARPAAVGQPYGPHDVRCPRPVDRVARLARPVQVGPRSRLRLVRPYPTMGMVRPVTVSGWPGSTPAEQRTCWRALKDASTASAHGSRAESDLTTGRYSTTPDPIRRIGNRGARASLLSMINSPV
jgi:hypothetical protein